MSWSFVGVGAGMGGLAAALRLARRGFSVRVVEARAEAGGLASGFESGGWAFDAGPYVLLDRPGLEWAFGCLGLELDEHIPLRRIEAVYEVSSGAGAPIRFHADLARTAADMERQWPGSGERYTRFVASTESIHRRLRPLLRVARPTPADLLRSGAWRHAPFLLRPLGSVL